MTFDRIQVCGVLMIRQAEFMGGRPHDAADLRVMRVAYVGKQMVLYLEIQTTGIPI